MLVYGGGGRGDAVEWRGSENRRRGVEEEGEEEGEAEEEGEDEEEGEEGNEGRHLSIYKGEELGLQIEQVRGGKRVERKCLSIHQHSPSGCKISWHRFFYRGIGDWRVSL